MTMNPSPLRVMLKLVSEYTTTVLNVYHLTVAEPQHVHVFIKIANDHVLSKIGEHDNTSSNEITEKNWIPKMSLQNDFYILNKYWVTGTGPSRLNKTYVFSLSPLYLYLTIQWLLSEVGLPLVGTMSCVQDRS